MVRRLILTLASTLLIISCDLFESDNALNVIPGLDDARADAQELSSEIVHYSSDALAVISSEVQSTETELPLKKSLILKRSKKKMQKKRKRIQKK